MQLRNEASGTSVLAGALPDQAALYGVLLKLDRLGLTLLSLESSETLDEAQDTLEEPYVYFSAFSPERMETL